MIEKSVDSRITEIMVHAKNMRKYALDMAYEAGTSAAHFGGGMSIIDIMATLYFGVANTVQKGMKAPERDRIILSKGHGVLGYYAALVEAGFIDRTEIASFEKDESALLGHPVMCREKGIEFTNGSLGMGLSLGIGVAIANQKRQLPNKVYVIMGDGECNEGSVWEAFMAAPQLGVNRLVAIIDHNGFQLGGKNEDIMNIDSMEEKLKAFHWNVQSCDGHNIEQLLSALEVEEGPLAIVAKTVKGKGFSFAEDNNTWHHNVLTKKQYELAMVELEEK